MANTGNSIKCDAIREIAASSLTTDYQPLGGPLLRDAFRVWMTNYTNGDVYFSIDGQTNNKKLPGPSGRAYDDKTNDMYWKAGTQFYVKFDVVPDTPEKWVALEIDYV